MTVDRIAAAFDAMAEQYERGRPGWPADAIATLLDRFGARTVLDLAAGTGKLTEVLAERAEVVAVEPLEGMRRVLQARLRGVRALAGTAEAIPLPHRSVDAVFVAEAFHWFDLERAPAEIARVLRPGGGLAVMWNLTAGDDPAWMDGLLAMVASWSAIGGLSEDRRAVALDAVREVLERHGVDEVTLRYKAAITTARRVDD